MKVNIALWKKNLKKRSGPQKRKKADKFVREELHGIKEGMENNSSTLENYASGTDCGQQVSIYTSQCN